MVHKKNKTITIGIWIIVGIILTILFGVFFGTQQAIVSEEMTSDGFFISQTQCVDVNDCINDLTQNSDLTIIDINNNLELRCNQVCQFKPK